MVGLKVALLLASLVVSAEIFAHELATAPWDMSSEWPDRVSVSPGEDATTELRLNWRTDATISSAVAQYAEAREDSRFDLMAKTVVAQYQRIDPEKIRHSYSRSGTPNHAREPVHFFSATLGDLKPDTLYAWRVRGSKGKWSEWFQTRTAPTGSAVEFLYFGDAQYGIRSHASRLFRQAALQTRGRASFTIHAGDLVNHGDRDTEWAEWFDAGDFLHAMTPIIPVAGNHEYLQTEAGGSKDGLGVLSDLWKPHFNLPTPEDLPEEFHEVVYKVTVDELLAVYVLDSSRKDWQSQLNWMVKHATDDNARWRVAAMHHSPYRPGIGGYVNNPERGSYHRNRQAAFIEAAEAAGIDLILAGHNHSYTRAAIGEPKKTNPRKTQTSTAERIVDSVVVVSISGAMSGKMTRERFEAGNKRLEGKVVLDRWATNTPTFQHVSITGDSLSMRAYTASGQLYDAFQLNAVADGKKSLINQIPNRPTRHFENTGPYEGKQSLR